MPKCWICGGLRETSEHRVKKSDVVREFGKGPYIGPDALVHVKAATVRTLQGPDSTLLRYEKNLCSSCNSGSTKPFDKAYERFIGWAMDNAAVVVKRRIIDLVDAFGVTWEDDQRNLFKYFAKCFGCRLDEAGRAVPHDVVALLDKTSFTTRLYVTFAVNEDILAADLRTVGTDPLIVHQNLHSGNEVGFQCGHYHRWLTMRYWYAHGVLDPVGSPWVANTRCVYLGWDAPLTPSQRAEMLSRLATSREKGTA
jgi:hypothetical protein